MSVRYPQTSTRITAAAAWHRSDLVFPLGEVRDASGRILRNAGLGTFRRRWSIAERLRDRRTAVRERRSRGRLNRQWLTVLLFALATALLSGALGLGPGMIDNWRTHGWGGDGQSWTAWLTVGFGAAGAVMLGVATWRWRQRNVIIDARGTAYVIEEQVITQLRRWWPPTAPADRRRRTQLPDRCTDVTADRDGRRA